MGARILVVDDMEPNIRLLEAKLNAEFYDVVAAKSGQRAINIAREQKIDLILLDAMMPGLNGFETCKRLKEDPRTTHIPVIIVTALEERTDRIRGLEVGADDFISKPINDLHLMVRVRSLLRLKVLTDELMSHAQGNDYRQLVDLTRLENRGCRVLIVDDSARQVELITEQLHDRYQIEAEFDPRKALEASRGGIDLIVINIGAKGFNGFQLCARLKVEEATRDIPVMVIVDSHDEAQLQRASDLGINDIVTRPVDREELKARIRSQLLRKLYRDKLKELVNTDLQSVGTDPLTGLGNRQYLERAAAPVFEQAGEGGTASIMVFDLDHFKWVNDTFGHDMGDRVLKIFSARLASQVRGVDIVCRFGGEEFIVLMPDTNEADAMRAAERVRSITSNTPFNVQGMRLTITVSAGVAELLPGENMEGLFKRADDALYAAKASGRDKVMASTARKAA